MNASALASVFTLNTSAARTRLIGDALWVAVGQGFAAIGLLVGMRLLTEVVPPRVFGTVALLLAIATLGYNFLYSPLLSAGTRFYSEAAASHQLPELRRSLKRLLLRATFGLILLSLAASMIYSAGRGLSAWMFLALAGLMALDAARALEVNLLIAARRQRPAAIWSAAEAWGRPAVAFLAVTTWGVSPERVLAGYAAASAVCYVVFVLTTPREGIVLAQRQAFSELQLTRDVLHYALPLMPLALVGWVSSYSDRYVIASILGVERVGIFAAAVGLVSRPFLMAGTVVGQTLRPLYFSAVTAGDRGHARRLFRLWLTVTAAISVAGFGAFVVTGDLIGKLLLAESYRSSLSLLPGIAVGYGLLALANTLGERFLAYKRTRTFMLIHAGMALSYLALSWPLIRRFGLEGAVIAFALNSLTTVALLALIGKQIVASRKPEVQ